MARWMNMPAIKPPGGAWVSLNPSHTVGDNAVLMDRFDVEVVFCAPSVADQVEQMKERLPGVRRWVVLGAGAIAGDPVLVDWVSSQPATKLDLPPHGVDDVVAVYPTVGTTGSPKGVMNTRRISRPIPGWMEAP